jgi:hypothetical protein
VALPRNVGIGPACDGDHFSGVGPETIVETFRTKEQIMTQQKPEEQIDELANEQLDQVTGGTPPKQTTKPTPTKSKGLFEVEDFSFDIEQTLN